MQTLEMQANEVIIELLNKIKQEPNNYNLVLNLIHEFDKINDHAQAEHYLKYLEKRLPENVDIKFHLGKEYLVQSKHHEAINAFTNALALNPFNSKIYHNLAKAYEFLKLYDPAITNLNNAIEFADNEQDKFDAYTLLGKINLDQQDINAAVSNFSLALMLKPTNELAILNLSIAFAQQNNSAKAQEILDSFPKNSNLNFLKIIHQSFLFKNKGEIEKGIFCLEEGLTQEPTHAGMLYVKLAELHGNMSNFPKAIEYLKLALPLSVNRLQILQKLVENLMQTKEYVAAKQYINEAMQLEPSWNNGYVHLALICSYEKNYDGALGCIDVGMMLNPNEKLFYLIKADVYLKKYFEAGHADNELEKTAISCYLKALELFPNDASITARINNVRRMRSYDLELKITSASLQRLFLAYDRLHDKLADPLYFTKDESLALASYCGICAANLYWDKLNYAKPILEKILLDQLANNNKCCIAVFNSHYLFPDMQLQLKIAKDNSEAYNSNNKYKHTEQKSNSKLRIAYISPDFNEHVVGFIINEMFKYHDRNKFEVYAYSIRDKDCAQKTRIKNSVDYFKELTELSDANAAAVIYKDNIDILVDLAGYSSGCRPEILGLQPAKMQAHFLGEVGTMGADFIQYHFACTTQIPQKNLPYYTENIVYLPETMIAMQQHVLPQTYPTRTEYGLPENCIVFCCFNNNYRITEETFTCWMDILKAVPNSVLWLNSTDSKDQQIKKHAKLHGVDPSRLIMKQKSLLNIDWHHILADIYLDTFIIAGGTTAVLSMWIGLPVVTLAGDCAATLVGASILSTMGIHETIAQTKEEYFNIAVQLATNPAKLKDIKNKILNNKTTNPLFDQERLIKHLEVAYMMMDEDYKSGKNARTITVPKLPN